MDEAIQELKENEFKDIFKDENNRKAKVFVKDSRFESDMEILIPTSYVQQTEERLVLYKKLDASKTEEELEALKAEMLDRFGPIPAQVSDLFNSLQIRWMAQALGFEKVIIKSQTMIAWLVFQQESDYYYGPIFPQIIQYIQANPTAALMKESKGKLILNFGKTTSVTQALSKVSLIYNWVQNKE